MTNLSRLVAASFSSLALSSSVSMANLSCLLVTTFSSLKLLSNSLSSPRFHLLRVGRRCYSVVFCFITFASYPQHTEAPFALTLTGQVSRDRDTRDPYPLYNKDVMGV